MNRLETVQSLLSPCGTFADVGCDHGYVADYVSKNGLAERVICSDVSAGSLAKAKALLGCRAEYILCDGFAGYDVPVDLAVVGGMGGHNIIDIVAASPVTVCALVVQPQTDAAAVRKFLSQKFIVTDDVTAEERGRFYDVIRAERGRMAELTETQLLFGVYWQERSETFLRRLTAWEKKLAGYPATAKNRHLLELLKEVKKCQQ